MMRFSRSVPYVLLFAVPAISLAQRPATSAPQPVRQVDWSAISREAQQLLSDYLRINTSNPPGNEMHAALFLRRVLEREGFVVQILDSAEQQGRVNLYTRLRGNGKKRAIALVHHMDVVPATSGWTVDPFSGLVRDGYIYGRGAIDMKGEGIAHLMALIALKRSGVPLNRDIVFIANPDEELSSTGALVFVNRHADLLRDVEYIVTEATENSMKDGKIQYFSIGVSEKRTFWQKLTVKGIPSHGSRPTPDNPVRRLVRALERIAAYETPLHVTPGVDRFFRDISRLYAEPQRSWLANVGRAVKNPQAREWILKDVYWNAMLRNTISITVLNGSNKTNVIPAEASAEIDVRLLPDQDASAMLATLKRLAADTAIRFTTLLEPKPPLENPIETELFRAIERAALEREPSAFVTTRMQTGATDRPTYRKLGIITYAVDPFKIEQAERQRAVHGNDERLSVENLAFGVRYIYDILRHAQ